MSTQRDTILELLQERGATGVNAAEVIYQHGITRVAARVADLRRDGWDIETREQRGHTATYILRGISPLKPGATPPPPVPVCPKCGITLTKIRPSLSPSISYGDCPTHKSQPVRTPA